MDENPYRSPQAEVEREERQPAKQRGGLPSLWLILAPYGWIVLVYLLSLLKFQLSGPLKIAAIGLTCALVGSAWWYCRCYGSLVALVTTGLLALLAVGLYTS